MELTQLIQGKNSQVGSLSKIAIHLFILQSDAIVSLKVRDSGKIEPLCPPEIKSSREHPQIRNRQPLLASLLQQLPRTSSHQQASMAHTGCQSLYLGTCPGNGIPADGMQGRKAWASTSFLEFWLGQVH